MSISAQDNLFEDEEEDEDEGCYICGFESSFDDPEGPTCGACHDKLRAGLEPGTTAWDNW